MLVRLVIISFFVVSLLVPFVKFHPQNYYLNLNFTLIVFFNFLFAIFIINEQGISLKKNDKTFIVLYLFFVVTISLAIHDSLNKHWLNYLYVCSITSCSIALKHTSNYTFKRSVSDSIILIYSIIIGIHLSMAFINSRYSAGYYNKCFSNLGLFSSYITLFFPIFFSKFVVSFQKKEIDIFSFWYGLLSFTIIISVILNNTRSSWLAICLFLVLIFYLFYVQNLKTKKNSQIRKKLLIIFMILFTGFLIVSYWIKKDSADGRLIVWYLSLKMFLDHPFTGIGFNNFEAHYNLYQGEFFKSHHELRTIWLADDVYVAYNEFLQSLCEIGISIIIFWFLLFKYVYCKCHKIINIGIENIDWGHLSYLGFICVCFVSFSFSYPLSIIEIANAIFLINSVIELNID